MQNQLQQSPVTINDGGIVSKLNQDWASSRNRSKLLPFKLTFFCVLLDKTCQLSCYGLMNQVSPLSQSRLKPLSQQRIVNDVGRYFLRFLRRPRIVFSLQLLFFNPRYNILQIYLFRDNGPLYFSQFVLKRLSHWMSRGAIRVGTNCSLWDLNFWT